jgi:DNA-binding LacI/PurR family transcriptional regulator
MKDVAREAGVALGTVSRVFNGFPVGDEYRERVEAAAEKLNYRVNNYARGLKTNKTFCVGLLMPSMRHPFFAALIDELTASLMRHGYLTHVMITNFDPDAEQKSFTLVEQNKVDGIIALTDRGWGETALLLALTYPDATVRATMADADRQRVAAIAADGLVSNLILSPHGDNPSASPLHS